MKTKRLVTIIVVCIALIVAALPLLSACDGGGKEDKTLKVGITTPTTGKAAEKGAPMGHGNLDCFEYINNELGGVEGYQVEVVWRDNGYDASKVVTIVKNFMDEGCLMYTTSSSAMMTASMEIANRAGFPGMAAFSSPIIYRPPQHIYGQMPDYGDDFLAFAKYYMDKVWKGSGKPKFAIHALNNSTGKGAIDAALAYADSLGIEILWDGQPGKAFEHKADSTSEMESLTRIKAMNPDVLYISSTPAPTALIVKNSYELGIYPGITIGSGHAGFTSAFVDIAGADIAEGVYGVFPTVSWGDDVPAMAKMTEYVQKNHPGDYEKRNMDYITCWAQSLIVAEILRVAVKNVGYDVLAKGDAAAWKAIEEQGIQKLKDYDVGGLHGPVSYTPGDNRLSKSVRVFQVQGGEIKPLTDWIDAPVVKYEEFDWFGK
ncbi:MAG TPA: ABC transporter substrate-binding protein [Dehalococcoidales bacterium]|nr:ABC transporter substrate-binding protein [Dehalococcoidales bacterium]